MNQTSKKPQNLLTALGLATGLGATVAASCCILPLVIGGLGAGAGVFAVLEIFANYRAPLLVISSVLVASAWVLYFRRRGTRNTAAALALASVLVLTAASWNWFEPSLLKIVRASR